MDGFMRNYRRVALGLGAAALLCTALPASASPPATVSGVPAAGVAARLEGCGRASIWPGLSGWGLAAADAGSKGASIRLVQGPPSPEALKLQELELQEQRRQREQQKMEKMQQPEQQQNRQMERRTKSAAPPRDAPAKAGTRKFGAQPIRSKEPLEGE